MSAGARSRRSIVWMWAAGTATNFGWPCYEGFAPQPVRAAGLASCLSLYVDGTATPPHFAYDHSDQSSRRRVPDRFILDDRPRVLHIGQYPALTMGRCSSATGRVSASGRCCPMQTGPPIPHRSSRSTRDYRGGRCTSSAGRTATSSTWTSTGAAFNAFPISRRTCRLSPWPRRCRPPEFPAPRPVRCLRLDQTPRGLRSATSGISTETVHSATRPPSTRRSPISRPANTGDRHRSRELLRRARRYLHRRPAAARDHHDARAVCDVEGRDPISSRARPRILRRARCRRRRSTGRCRCTIARRTATSIRFSPGMASPEAASARRITSIRRGWSWSSWSPTRADGRQRLPWRCCPRRSR